VSVAVAALSIESLPLLSQILMLALTIVTVFLVLYLLQPWWQNRRRSQREVEIHLPEAITVSGKPLIHPSEVALFNLLHFVSRDMFFVFAKIPLRLLVNVQTDDENARREMVRALRTLTADYVLVHPGTMLVRKIIMITSPDVEGRQSHPSLTLLTVLCQEAEIDLIQLEADKTYSAQELTERLGLQEED